MEMEVAQWHTHTNSCPACTASRHTYRTSCRPLYFPQKSQTKESWTVAHWIESQMPEFPLVFSRGYSCSLCLFVGWGASLRHKGFSQTCAYVLLHLQLRHSISDWLDSCPDQHRLTLFVCHFGTWPVFRHCGPGSKNATRALCPSFSIVQWCPPKTLSVAQRRHPAKGRRRQQQCVMSAQEALRWVSLGRRPLAQMILPLLM